MTWRIFSARHPQPPSWWRHQMETFSALLVICAVNSPVNSPHKKPVTRSFNVFFDLRLNKRLSKQSWGWWFETLSRSLWRHRNDDDIWLVGAYAVHSIYRSFSWVVGISSSLGGFILYIYPYSSRPRIAVRWWRHGMETFSVLLAHLGHGIYN